MTNTKANTADIAANNSSKKGTVSGKTVQDRTSFAAYMYAVDASGVRLTRSEYEELLANRMAD